MATQIASMCRIGIALLALLVLPAGTTAHADLLDVRVDIGTAAASGTPTGWCAIADPSDTATVHDLADFNTGLSSGVTLQFTDAFGTSTNDAGAFSWSNPQGAWIDAGVLRDYAYLTPNDTGQITLGGLVAGDAYQVELLAVRNHDWATNETYRVNGAAGLIVDAGGTATTWSGKTNGYTNQDFMRWESAVADAQGKIIIDAASGTSTNPAEYTFFNGLRISVVPEPSSWVLLIVAIVVGSATRRMRPR